MTESNKGLAKHEALLAQLAAKTAECERLRGEIEYIVKMNESRRDLNAPEDRMIKDLCERIGYGAVMDSAARQWQRKDNWGAHTTAGAVGVLKIALSTPTPPGLGEKMVELCRAAYNVEGFSYRTVDPNALAAFDLLHIAVESLTPEELKTLGVG